MRRLIAKVTAGAGHLQAAAVGEARWAMVDFPGRKPEIAAMKFRVVIEPDEDGVFVAECPTLPGCVSQGKTREEALTNVKDAIAGYLASLRKHDEPVPLPITEEVVEVPA
jgi:predicted RNase H-like HicB family nuclease